MATYVHNPSCLTPAMTSNTAPAPVSLSADGGVYPIYYAFNQNGASGSYYSCPNNVPVNVQINSGLSNGNGWKCTSYTVTSSNNLSYTPNTWVLYGSKNLVDWVQIDSRTGEAGWLTNEMRTYNILAPDVYASYRFYITAANGQTQIFIAEIELIGTVELLSKKTNLFFLHG